MEWLWLPSVQHASKGSESAQELSSKKPCRCCGTPSVSVAITATRFDGKRPRDKESSQHRVRVQLVHQALHPSSAVQCSSICLVWGNEREAAALEFLINRSRSLIAQASNRRETRTEKKSNLSRSKRKKRGGGADLEWTRVLLGQGQARRRRFAVLLLRPLRTVNGRRLIVARPTTRGIFFLLFFSFKKNRKAKRQRTKTRGGGG